jgi:hypothetical protein
MIHSIEVLDLLFAEVEGFFPYVTYVEGYRVRTIGLCIGLKDNWNLMELSGLCLFFLGVGLISGPKRHVRSMFSLVVVLC